MLPFQEIIAIFPKELLLSMSEYDYWRSRRYEENIFPNRNHNNNNYYIDLYLDFQAFYLCFHNHSGNLEKLNSDFNFFRDAIFLNFKSISKKDEHKEPEKILLDRGSEGNTSNDQLGPDKNIDINFVKVLQRNFGELSFYDNDRHTKMVFNKCISIQQSYQQEKYPMLLKENYTNPELSKCLQWAKKIWSNSFQYVINEEEDEPKIIIQTGSKKGVLKLPCDKEWLRKKLENRGKEVLGSFIKRLSMQMRNYYLYENPHCLDSRQPSFNEIN